MNSLKIVLLAGFMLIASVFLNSGTGYTIYFRHTYAVIFGSLGVFIAYFLIVLTVKGVIFNKRKAV